MPQRFESDSVGNSNGEPFNESVAARRRSSSWSPGRGAAATAPSSGPWRRARGSSATLPSHGEADSASSSWASMESSEGSLGAPPAARPSYLQSSPCLLSCSRRCPLPHATGVSQMTRGRAATARWTAPSPPRRGPVITRSSAGAPRPTRWKVRRCCSRPNQTRIFEASKFRNNSAKIHVNLLESIRNSMKFINFKIFQHFLHHSAKFREKFIKNNENTHQMQLTKKICMQFQFYLETETLKVE